MSSSKPWRLVTGLREVAHRYRGIVFDAASLHAGREAGGGGLWAPCSASVLESTKNLLSRDKKVAVISGSAIRSKGLSSAMQSSGMPTGIFTWSSGELICRSFEGQISAGSAFEKLKPLTELGRPPKVFELASLVKPRRWSDVAKRGDPPLARLAQGGFVKRTDDIEEADVCFWDAQEGDELDHWVEAVVELCADLKVPLLQPRRSASALKALSSSAGRGFGTPESAAHSLERLGGKVLSVGKLDSCLDGMGWEEDLSSREVLLVSQDLGDVVEASEKGIDVLLLLGSRTEGQLSSWRQAEAEISFEKRKSLSVSQRVAQDSPGLMAAAQNPFLSVFKLPSLLAEATRSNAEHRAQKATSAHAKQAADTSSGTLTAEASPPPSQEAVNVLEELSTWCDAMKVQPPVAIIMPPPLLWDINHESRPASMKVSTMTDPQVDRKGGLLREGRDSAATATTTTSSKPPEPESLDDLLAQISKPTK